MDSISGYSYWQKRSTSRRAFLLSTPLHSVSLSDRLVDILRSLPYPPIYKSVFIHAVLNADRDMFGSQFLTHQTCICLQPWTPILFTIVTFFATASHWFWTRFPTVDLSRTVFPKGLADVISDKIP